MEQFELITKITEVQTIASGHGIKILPCKVMSIKDIHKKSLALCIDAGEYQGVSLFAVKI